MMHEVDSHPVSVFGAEHARVYRHTVPCAQPSRISEKDPRDASLHHGHTLEGEGVSIRNMKFHHARERGEEARAGGGADGRGRRIVDTAASPEVDAWIAAAPWRHAAGPAPEREPSRCASGPDAGPPFPSAYGCLMAAPSVAREEEIQYCCHECAGQRPRSLFSPCLVHRHVMTPPAASKHIP